MNEKAQWFAIRVRPRCEKLAAADLERRGFEALSACAPERRIWSDRVRTVEMPMFPGYIFAQFERAQAPQVLRGAGVISIVGFGSSYCPVDEAEIEALRIVLLSGVEVTREPLIRVGTPVRVRHGALQGLEGLLVQVKNRNRLVISVELLQRSVTVEMEHLMIEALTMQPSSVRASCTAA